MVYKGQVIAYVNPLRAGAVYNDSPVHSPISGRITSLPTTVGSTVSQSSPIATVARTDDLEIKINIAERFISRISPKQKATVTFDAYPSVEFPATNYFMILDITKTELQFDFNTYEELIGYYKNYTKEIFGVKDIYCERHHILPRCMGGDNRKENLIYLPWMVHCLAHYLLAKQLESIDSSLAVKNYYAVQRILGQCKIEKDVAKEVLINNIKLKAIQLETNESLGKRIYVNDGKNTLTILSKDLEYYLEKGWVKGRLFNQFGKGTVWMNDGHKSYQVKQEDVEDYLAKGFCRGMYKTSAMKSYSHSNSSTSGRLAIHKGSSKKYIDKKELNKYLEEGWVLGTGLRPRLGATVPQEVRDKISKGLRKRYENKISNM